MSEWDTLLKVITFIFGLLTTLAAGLMALQQGSLRLLRQSNTDLRDRVSDLEKEVSELRTDLADEKGRVKVLESTVTGEVHWVTIEDLLQEALKMLGQLVAGVSWLKDALTSLRDSLKSRRP